MHLIETRRTTLSPYTTLVERIVDIDGQQSAFHALDQADYANVLAVTQDDKVAVVRQYRPAIDQMTLELPGGLVDHNETAETAARRELYEEAGLRTDSFQLVGKLKADTGRLLNTAWGFVAQGCTFDPQWRAEAETEVILIPRHEYYAMILRGDFEHGLHVAIAGLAVMRGMLPSL